MRVKKARQAVCLCTKKLFIVFLSKRSAIKFILLHFRLGQIGFSSIWAFFLKVVKTNTMRRENKAMLMTFLNKMKKKSLIYSSAAVEMNKRLMNLFLRIKRKVHNNAK